MDNLEVIKVELQKGNMQEVVRLCKEEADSGTPPQKILDSLLSGMGVIGEKFKKNEIFVPEVLIAARAMNAGIEIIKPLIVDEDVKSTGTFVLGTVKGDLHDIGKNLVSMMLVGAGFKVIDLGVDVPPEKFVEAVKEHDADIVGMSALLTTTMDNMKPVIDALEANGLRDKVKIMVGGAPVTEEFAQKIGADKYTPDAATAAEEAKKLVE